MPTSPTGRDAAGPDSGGDGRDTDGPGPPEAHGRHGDTPPPRPDGAARADDGPGASPGGHPRRGDAVRRAGTLLAAATATMLLVTAGCS
ncbi:alpha/beta hydrolase, partial [Streptomyces wuyuanensis]